MRAATMAELARVGFPGLTIEGVAKAAAAVDSGAAAGVLDKLIAATGRPAV